MIRGLFAGVLAFVALGALALIYFHPWRSNTTQLPLPRVESAQAGGQKLAINKKIGVWSLQCLKPIKLPDWAKASLGGKVPAPKDPKILHCSVYTQVASPLGGSQWVRFIFGPTGPSRILNVRMKLGAGLAAAGDVLNMRLNDATDIAVRVLLCGKDSCVAVPMRPVQDLESLKQTAGEQLVAAKDASLIFPAAPGAKAVTIDIPTKDLPAAIAALRDVTPVNTQSLH
ncbi:MAG: hypothetical protein WDM89_18910 [Rhizomicrobium sp.]